MAKQPTTLIEAITYFANPDNAFEFVKRLRWADGEPVCPRCGCVETSFLATRRIWKCKACKRQFSLKVGTIFEDSPIGFEKWLPAMWMIANSKNSVSSHELARALGVTQKTAWFMLHRIRAAMATETFKQLGGTVEVDETYVGGAGKNVHRRVIRLRGPLPKIAIQGARERGTGNVKAAVVSGELKANVHAWVAPGSTVYTDEASAYRGLSEHFTHDAIVHGGPEKNRYVRGDVHTNGIESFWALLKRSIKGTQTHVSRKHADRYVTEREFAYNLRNDTDLTRMRTAVAGAAGRRVTWKALTVGA